MGGEELINTPAKAPWRHRNRLHDHSQTPRPSVLYLGLNRREACTLANAAMLVATSEGRSPRFGFNR